jgi:hypothetical protein
VGLLERHELTALIANAAANFAISGTAAADTPSLRRAHRDTQEFRGLIFVESGVETNSYGASGNVAICRLSLFVGV